MNLHEPRESEYTVPESHIPDRRQYDKRIEEENKTLFSKIDALTTVVNNINTNVLVFIAKSEGTQRGVEERLRRLEDWQGSTNKYIIGIAIVIGTALFFAITKGAGIPLK